MSSASSCELQTLSHILLHSHLINSGGWLVQGCSRAVAGLGDSESLLMLIVSRLLSSNAQIHKLSWYSRHRPLRRLCHRRSVDSKRSRVAEFNPERDIAARTKAQLTQRGHVELNHCPPEKHTVAETGRSQRLHQNDQCIPGRSKQTQSVCKPRNA
eukprot:766786-Hanusia_phi.AAC.1